MDGSMNQKRPMPHTLIGCLKLAQTMCSETFTEDDIAMWMLGAWHMAMQFHESQASQDQKRLASVIEEALNFFRHPPADPRAIKALLEKMDSKEH
jgi:hypothetical protein